ncbi:MAG: DUF2490 domain-containing protein [Bacteroidetes bacterium]|nr:DUF2490 domain-containing protein [Bacteroidota bacterium]MDA1084690.1 DUF2490 domain-containing protein [Bacteroidota bacterium]
MALKYNISFLFLIFSTLSIAQNDICSWLIYKNKLKLNSKTSIDTQYQHRSFTLDFEEDQALITAGFSHALLENVIVSAGYRKIGALSENGMYQKIAFSTQLHNVKLTNSFFLEERWIGENFQLRYRFGLTAKIPLSSKTALSLTEEVFLQNSGTSFNQNRVTAQVSHKLSDALQLNSGIMHWQFPDLKSWVFLLSLSHTISL